MTGREVPRSVQAMIVRDLARGHRTTDSIAQRHHVPPAVVVALRNEHGPRPDDLIRAAGELDRPAKAASKVEAPKPPIGNTDGLTVAERATARAWALATGRTASAAGPISRALVAEWDAAGRPTATPLAPAKPETVPDATEPASEPVEPVADAAEVASDPVENQEAPEGEFERERLDAWTQPPVVSAGDAPAVASSVGAIDHDVIEAEILPFWSDWPDLLARADNEPAVAWELRAVADAVEMLRDALREHDHRESMVARIAQVIEELSPLGPDDIARAVLDAIEAA